MSSKRSCQTSARIDMPHATPRRPWTDLLGRLLKYRV